MYCIVLKAVNLFLCLKMPYFTNLQKMAVFAKKNLKCTILTKTLGCYSLRVVKSVELLLDTIFGFESRHIGLFLWVTNWIFSNFRFLMNGVESFFEGIWVLCIYRKRHTPYFTVVLLVSTHSPGHPPPPSNNSSLLTPLLFFLLSMCLCGRHIYICLHSLAEWKEGWTQ